MNKVAVCILTLQREKMLSRCLDSLDKLAADADFETLVVIVDNDQNQSARSLVEAKAASFSHPLYYYSEPRRGIPVARNSAIEEAHRLGADLIAFIDDDEWVDPAWLKNAYAYFQQHNANIVVSGNVISVFPEGTPEHICKAMQRTIHHSGVELSACATNNVLFPVLLTRDWGMRFDESRPLAGGTDTKFFALVRERGMKILKCAEATVYEEVPASRATLSWMSKRKYRAGITEYWRKRRDGVSLLRILLGNSMRVIVMLLTALLMLLLGNKMKRNRAWLKCCKSLGALSGMLGMQVDSYKKVDC